MKRLNFNIKDRKVLYMILGIVFISVFTLTVAYAALNAVLDISGSAQVSSAEWDVHFDNVKVTNGSVNSNAPVITSPTNVTFSTTLNMPGEFYEFTIDVVNDGSIDAMIENITKTPTLSTNQEKYLKYEITYQNGESITTRQLVEKKSFVRLKVRVEFRRDLSNSDLPKTSETLNLGLQLDYIQSDGSGSSIPVYGVGSGDASLIEAYGSLEEIGAIVKIGTEYFYSLGVEGENVRLFAVYNLMIGGKADSFNTYTLMDNASGLQNKDALGLRFSTDGYSIKYPITGVIEYSNNENKGDTLASYEGSLVEKYVNNYESKIESMGVNVISSRILNEEDLKNVFNCDMINYLCLNTPYSWVYSTSYWINGTTSSDNSVWAMISDGNLSNHADCGIEKFYGVRPVIVVYIDDILKPTLIDFTINDVTYQAREGMTWGEWVNSRYNTNGFYIKTTQNNMIYSSSGYDVYINYKSVISTDVINANGTYKVETSGIGAPK